MWWLFMIVLCEAGKHARCLNALKKCTSAVEGWRMLLTKMQQWTKHGKGLKLAKLLCFGVDGPPCCVFLVFKLSSFAAFYFYEQMKKHHSLPNYRIVQNFDVFDAFQLDRQNLTHQIEKQHSIYRCIVKDSDNPSQYFPSNIWRVGICQNFPLSKFCAIQYIYG